ncbi:hypothetical protein DPMN_128843 [Dreissena polymorpha]|uniref:Uncharacterized protein n=1 Tax=Dreissena polymorpha TaxID=45954 RepID=A0A9D4H4P4_DREPO|nr:hypothetical protein DPMN_128843 [Dreissena polymorpha]
MADNAKTRKRKPNWSFKEKMCLVDECVAKTIVCKLPGDNDTQEQFWVATCEKYE